MFWSRKCLICERWQCPSFRLLLTPQYTVVQQSLHGLVNAKRVQFWKVNAVSLSPRTSFKSTIQRLCHSKTAQGCWRLLPPGVSQVLKESRTTVNVLCTLMFHNSLCCDWEFGLYAWLTWVNVIILNKAYSIRIFELWKKLLLRLHLNSVVPLLHCNKMPDNISTREAVLGCNNRLWPPGGTDCCV